MTKFFNILPIRWLKSAGQVGRVASIPLVLGACSVGYALEDAGKDMARGNVIGGAWTVLMTPVIAVADVATFGSISQEMTERRRAAPAAEPGAVAAYEARSEARSQELASIASAMAVGPARSVQVGQSSNVGPRTAALAAVTAAIGAQEGVSSAPFTPSGSQGSSGGQCSTGPRCNAIQSRALPLIERIGAGQQASIEDASMRAFCIFQITAEALRNCAMELREMGRPDCASLVDADMNNFLTSAQQARSTNSQVSTINWQPRCGWR